MFSKGKITSEIINNDNNITLIVFGWTASSYEEVKQKCILLKKLKISKLITVVTPIMTTVFSDYFIKETVNDLKQHISQSDYIYILYYSGGGSLYHPVVHKEITLSKKYTVCGYIFDSSPVPFGVSVFMKWLNNIFLQMIFVMPLFMYMYLFAYKRLNYYNDYILNVPFEVDTLFITSNNDKLVPIKTTLKIVENQNCYLKIFDSSDHISHDVKYPDEYFNLLNEFVN